MCSGIRAFGLTLEYSVLLYFSVWPPPSFPQSSSGYEPPLSAIQGSGTKQQDPGWSLSRQTAFRAAWIGSWRISIMRAAMRRARFRANLSWYFCRANQIVKSSEESTQSLQEKKSINHIETGKVQSLKTLWR